MSMSYQDYTNRNIPTKAPVLRAPVARPGLQGPRMMEMPTGPAFSRNHYGPIPRGNYASGPGAAPGNYAGGPGFMPAETTGPGSFAGGVAPVRPGGRPPMQTTGPESFPGFWRDKYPQPGPGPGEIQLPDGRVGRPQAANSLFMPGSTGDRDGNNINQFLQMMLLQQLAGQFGGQRTPATGSSGRYF